MTATAPRTSAEPAGESEQFPTIWGLTPIQLHDRLWAALGVQVVRRNEPSEIVEDAELFLLCDPHALTIFRPAQVLESVYWLDPALMMLRVNDPRETQYREEVVTDGDKFVRFRRVYRDRDVRSSRMALTSDVDVARMWQNAPEVRTPWRWLRSRFSRDERALSTVSARMYDGSDPVQIMECLHAMMGAWHRPDTSIGRAVELRENVWTDPTSTMSADTRTEGPVWVGAGRTIPAGEPIVGPALFWDDPEHRPVPQSVEWLALEPTAVGARDVRPVRSTAVPGKRLFDVLFSASVLLLILPLFPLVALAIYVEDGGPIFFAHKRESRGGLEFGCLKFRSMRNDASEIKERLLEENQADGPQFFMEDDPRITRVGRFLRRTQIDELPQFLNVLRGHMSIVGPRPSPHSENQFCPAWREARLSVRPGVTGLWQVSRTRQAGLDFQEWIRFDLEYVENASWSLDLSIIARTLGIVLKGLR